MRIEHLTSHLNFNSSPHVHNARCKAKKGADYLGESTSVENKSVNIGSGSWIAAHCVVLPGAFLPARSVLAAGAVLTDKLVPQEADSIYAGIPASFVKRRKDFRF